MRCFVLSALLLATACNLSGDGKTLDNIDEDTPLGFNIVQSGGCADVVFFASEQDQVDGTTAYLRVSVQGLLEEALASGETTRTVYSVKDPTVSFEIVTGANLTRPCNDVAEVETIDSTYAATEGTLTITIEPGDASLPEIEARGVGSLKLEGVRVKSGDDEEILKDFSIDAVAVGWLPG